MISFTRTVSTTACAYLDHRISLNVVFETLQLQVKYWRERLEDDTLLGVLKSVSLRLIFVLAVEGFHRYIILERLVQVLHTLDVQLDVCIPSP